MSMRELEYPFDAEYILRKRKAIRRALLEGSGDRLVKRIAVLGGSTTHDIVQILELFLLNAGIEPVFYESDYGQYFNDVMFDNPALAEFRPDLVYIHTTSRNILKYPEITDTAEQTDQLLTDTILPFERIWDRLAERYHCPVIQNNFQMPHYRLLGNRDTYDLHGRRHFILQLNERIHAYAAAHEAFHVQDIDYMAACFGLQKWSDPFYWHMYKYEPAVPAIPELAFNLSNIIKSIFGKNKKALALDLDNTLWGGIVGDDGPEHIEIGQETPAGQLYAEFQQYLKAHRSLGVLLTVDSKNDEENALAGLSRPDSILRPEDFVAIKANWEPKDRNLSALASELNLGADAFVFVDDNPAERHIVREQLPGTGVPEIGQPQDYLITLDRCGYFETTVLSADDLKRNEMYEANLARSRQEASFTDYGAYLDSLDMKAEIGAFPAVYLSRIAQLTNKSNQFNLTTRRYTLTELEQIAADPNCITQYGRLTDRFGDNGVVSVACGHAEGTVFHIDLWLMSCRVLKRDMENAMMDVLEKRCRERGFTAIRGYYYPTAKNRMVRDFYGSMGFSLISADEEGNTVWEYPLKDAAGSRNQHIKITEVSNEQK